MLYMIQLEARLQHIIQQRPMLLLQLMIQIQLFQLLHREVQQVRLILQQLLIRQHLQHTQRLDLQIQR